MRPNAKTNACRRVAFKRIASAALSFAPKLVPVLLPDGKQRGDEWQARNPTRNDRSIGSFSINLRTGRWGDFATGDRGGDLIALVAYLDGISQVEAALEMADALGVNPWGGAGDA